MINVEENPQVQHLVNLDFATMYFKLPVVGMCGVVYELKDEGEPLPNCPECEKRMPEVTKAYDEFVQQQIASQIQLPADAHVIVERPQD